MNVLYYFEHMRNHINGKSMNDLFPSQFFGNIPYNQLQRGHCMVCHYPMTRDEMMPAHAQTPRAICPDCWIRLTSVPTVNCWVCNEELDANQLKHQDLNSHDLHYRIHVHDKCRDYFSLMSAFVLGCDTGVIELSDDRRVKALPYQPKPGLPIPPTYDAIGQDQYGSGFLAPGPQRVLNGYDFEVHRPVPVKTIGKYCQR